MAEALSVPTLDPGAVLGASPYAAAFAFVLAVTVGRQRLATAIRRAGGELTARLGSGPSTTTQAVGATWRSYAAEVPAWLIVFGAMAVSFWTQVQAVMRHAFAQWEALVWGTSTDFGTLACLFLAREGAHRGTPTWGAWVLSVACAVMSVQFNIVDGIERGDWLAVEAHVWMPALALGVWYWTLHGRHRRWSHRPVEQPAPTAVELTPSLPVPASSPARAARRPAAEVLGLVRTACEQLGAELGRRPSDEEVAARLTAGGHPITASRVRTYLARIRAEERTRTAAPSGGEEVLAWHA